jgi:hypothetical protein
MPASPFRLSHLALTAALLLPAAVPAWAIEYVKSIPEPGSRSGGLLGVPYLGSVRTVDRIQEPGAVPPANVENIPYLGANANWQGQGGRQPGRAFVERNVARRAAQHGFLINGTSGRNAEGYVEYIQWQPARVGGGSATGNGRQLIGVELGQETGWIRLDPQQARQLYENSYQKSMNYHREFNDWTQQNIGLTNRFLASQDVNERAQLLARMQEITAHTGSLVEMRAAEIELQQTLRPAQ